MIEGGIAAVRDINEIKNAVSEFYEQKTEIRVNVNTTKPRIHITDAPASITGVYKNLFTIEVIENGLQKVFSIPYTDIFIGKVTINEL